MIDLSGDGVKQDAVIKLGYILYSLDTNKYVVKLVKTGDSVAVTRWSPYPYWAQVFSALIKARNIAAKISALKNITMVPCGLYDTGSKYIVETTEEVEPGWLTTQCHQSFFL